VRLEQADQFLAGRHGFAGEDAALGLADEALDQGQVMVDLAAPGYGFDGGAYGQAPGGMPERGQGGTGGRDQVSVELGFLFFAATVLNGEGTLFCQPAVIAPDERRYALQRVGLREL
jgi:hypothetical protein